MKNILPKTWDNKYLKTGTSSSINYNFNHGSEGGNIRILNAQRTAIKFIEKFFSAIKALSSKPVFIITADKVIINIFYYVPTKNTIKKYNVKNQWKGKIRNKMKNNVSLDRNTINFLGDLLSNFFNRPVELRLIKLHYPYLDRTILAKYIRLNTKKYKFKKIQGKVFAKTPVIKYLNPLKLKRASQLPSYIVGIKVKLSGRLKTERVRPRKTVQTANIGQFSTLHNTLLDFGSYTGKNNHGAYTIKVCIRQKPMCNPKKSLNLSPITWNPKLETSKSSFHDSIKPSNS